MPIFDDEILGASVDRSNPKPNLYLETPNLPEVDTHLSSFGGLDLYDNSKQQLTGVNLDELGLQSENAPSNDLSFSSVSRKELLDNKRYPMYERGVDLENIYGLQQSAWTQWGHSLAKLGVNLVGTFAQSLTDIPNTISAIKNGDVSKLSGDPNGYEGTIDNWVKNFEDILPNYVSREEKAHPYLGIIPFAPGSANFWGESVIKNLGFMGGAILGSAVTDLAVGAVTGGIGEFPLIAEQIGKASLYLNKLAGGTNKVDKILELAQLAGKSEESLNRIQKLANLAAAQKVTTGLRYGMVTWGASQTESGTESRDGYRQVREELINSYKSSHYGEEPIGEDLQKIENYATDAMNVRFGVNMALLTVSNAVQFDNLFKSIVGANKGVEGSLSREIAESGKIGLKEGSLNEFEKKTPSSIYGKIWDVAKPVIPELFSEGVFEEGGQYAVERGTYDYYTRKYKNPDNKNNLENWNTLKEVTTSTLKGLHDQFNTTEGAENMIAGAITALLGHVGKNVYDRKTGEGVSKEINESINVLNRYGLTGILANKYDNTLNSLGIALEMKEAAKSGNVFKYKNLQHDAFFNFVYSRIPSNMHDVTIEQLNLLKELPKDEFEKTFGLELSQSNKSTVNEYVNSLISHANQIKEMHDSISSTFINPFKSVINPKTEDDFLINKGHDTFEEYKLNLIHSTSQINNWKERLSSIDLDLMKINPLINSEMLSKLTNEDQLKELSKTYEQEALRLLNTINDSSSYETKKSIKDEVKSLRTASEKINLELKSPTLAGKVDLFNYELNRNYATSKDTVNIGNIKQLLEYGTDINKITSAKQKTADFISFLSGEKGFKRFFEQEKELENNDIDERTVSNETETPVFKNKQKEKENVEEGREYISSFIKKAKVEKLEDSRYKITSSNGEVSYSNSKEEALKEAEDLDKENKNLEKIKVISINEDGTVKIQDINGDILNIPPDRLQGYSKVQTPEEKLAKFKETLDAQQREIELNTSVVPTISPEQIIKEGIESQGELKDADRLFISSTSPAEESITNPHVVRARVLFNNFRNLPNKLNIRALLITPKIVETLQLNGLIQSMYGREIDSDVNDIPDVNDVNKGFLAQLYIEVKGKEQYYINSKGERIGKVGEPVDINELVVETMPTTSLFYEESGQPRFRLQQQELAEKNQAGYKAFRENYFQKENPTAPYSFVVSKGRGIKNTVEGKRESNHIEGILATQEEIENTQGLITLNTTETISHNGELLKYPKGVPIIKNEDVLEFLNNRKFNDKEANSIYYVIKSIADEIITNSEKGKVVINKKLSSFLENIFYWKSKSDTISPNQIGIDTNKMTFNIGKNSYALSELESNKQELLNDIKEAYLSVNNKSLTQNFNEPFIEYTADKEGNITPIEWKNYQTYLLSSVNPDSSKRSTDNTPLTTSIAKPTEIKPYSFTGKYATLQLTLEFPNVETPIAKQETITPKEEASKIGDYIADGVTENTYTGVSSGPILFTLSKDGDIIVKESNNTETIDKVLENPKSVEVIKQILSTDTVGKQDVINFISQKIAAQIVELEKQQQETPTVEETKEPITDIDKKDNIEKQALLEKNVQDLKDKRNSLRGSDGVVPKENMAEWQQLGKDIKEAEAEATRGDNKGFIPIRTEQDGVLSGNDAIKAEKEIETIIQKILNKEITIDQAMNFIQYKYKLLANENIMLLQYIKDRTTDAPEIGNNKQSFAAWRKGGYDTELTTLENKKNPVTDIEAKKADIERRNTFTRATQMKVLPKGTPIFGGKTADGKTEFLDDELQFNNGDRITFFAEKERTGIYKDGKIVETGTNNPWGVVGILMDVKGYIKNQSKIDAELDALENKETPKPKTSLRNRASRTRLKANGEEGRMTDSDLETFKEWHAKNVPGIPYEVLENIITTHDGEKAWGVFEDGVAKFVKGGLRGTEYHEVFEGIWKDFLSEEEKNNILEEFRNKKGKFTDRASRKEYSYSDETITDNMVKERIADDFADYRLGKLPARTLGEYIRKFFKSIMDFFKSFVVKPSLKEELFKAIDAGRFKENVTDKLTPTGPEYRAVENLTEQQTHEYVQDMVGLTAGILFDEKDKGTLFSPQRITSEELFSQIKEEYDASGLSDVLSDKSWQELKEKTKDYLRTLGITFNEEDKVDINSEGANKNDYIPNPFSISDKSSFAIRFTLATMLEREPTNFDNLVSLDFPKEVLSSIGGFKLLNFSKTFATLLDKLSNTTKTSEAIDKLVELYKGDVNYISLFSRLGGDWKSGTISFNPSNFGKDDWRLFTQFIQVFTKQKPDALIQYNADGEYYTAPANLYNSIEQTKQNWIENMKALAQSDDSFIKYNQPTKTYRIDSDKLKNMPIKQPIDMINFLKEIGIDFPLDVYKSLKIEGRNNRESEREQFNKAVSTIKTYLGKNNDIMSVKGKVLDINSSLKKLAELYNKKTNPNQDSTYFGVEGQRVGAYTENNYISVFENEFNESEDLEELKQTRPELNDVFSTNSLVLKQGGNFFSKVGNRIKSLKTSYIQGTSNKDNNKGTVTAKLSLADRFTTEINQNLNGNYYVVINADKSTEWMSNLGNFISYKDLETTKGWNKIYDIFNGYLEDDILLALDADNRAHLANVGNKAKELRFFKDILRDKHLNKIDEMIEDGSTLEAIKEYITSNQTEINEDVKNYLTPISQVTKSILKENNKITELDGKFSFKTLDGNFEKTQNLDKNNLTEQELDNILNFTNINHVINNIEYHKIYFGDPYQFKIKGNQLDQTKRIPSFFSPRRTMIDSPEFNNFLNTQYNKAGEIKLSPKDPGYNTYDSYIPTITLKADVVVGSIAFNESVPKKIRDAYAKTEVADAAAWIIDSKYKELKLKDGYRWSDEAETWHQWQMAYTRQNMPGYEYTNSKLKEQDEKLLETPEPSYTLAILKPIATGSKYGSNNIDLILDKDSLFPIYYKMVQGTNLEKLYNKMFNENIGYAVMESGRKVGIEETNSLYNQDGSFNESPFINPIKVSWKSLGIQVDTDSTSSEGTMGSQLTKLASMDLYENGEPIGETPERKQVVKRAYDRNNRILNQLQQDKYNSLLTKLGVVDMGTNFQLEDGTLLSENLMYELMRRELSDNAKDTIKTDEEGNFILPFEASPSYTQIRSILFSFVNKALISPTVTGGGYIQAPVTMFEKNRALMQKTATGWQKISQDKYKTLSEEEKKSVVITDDTLKFYTKENPYCEILLPFWVKEKLLSSSKFKTEEELLAYLNSTDGGKILNGIGFRIPTQALSSAEVFKVKGFLPAFMGKTVIVPAEITTKAGSDFDIDKLNLYLKSIYIDKTGLPKLVKYYDSEETTKEFYSKVFDETLAVKQFKKAELLEAVDTLIYGLEDNKNLLNKYGEYIKSIQNDYETPYEFRDAIERKLETLSDENIQAELKKDFVNKMYSKALENEYFDSLQELLQLPENFEKLISPVDDAGLKDISDRLDVLRGTDESKIKNRILDKNYMTTLRHAFVTGKRWIGIAAVNITNLSLRQKSNIYLDTSKFENLSARDKEILGNGSIILTHNKDSEGRVSISGSKTADGKQLISQRLSGYATAFVDVAKDPFILKVIKSDLVVSTFMFLESIGAGETGIMFLNQPIIEEYLKMLDSQNSKNLFNKKSIEFIKNTFPTTTEFLSKGVINVNSLEDNISKYSENKLSESENAEQQLILDEFLKYAKMAENLFNFTQATNYDTTQFSSVDLFTRKQWRTQNAINNNIFSSVKKVMDTTFIGEKENLLSKSASAIGSIMKLDSTPFRYYLNSVLGQYGNKQFLSNDSFETIANKLRSSFLDYIIQTKSGVNDRVKELLVSSADSVVSKLERAKQRFPSIEILKHLQPVTSNIEGGAKSIRLDVNKKTAYDENFYTGMMRELRDYNPEMRGLYKDIVALTLLQGNYQSAISIKNIIPIEDYSNIVSPIIEQLVTDKTLDPFLEGMFQRNNFKDEDIMPTFTPRFFDSSTRSSEDIPVPIAIDSLGNEIYAYNSPNFANLKSIGIQSKDRRILLLDPKYNSYNIEDEYLKISKVIYNEFAGDYINMQTGQSVTKSEFAQRKSKGDNSLYDVYGYKKVFLPYPDEKGNKIPLTNEKGAHVYKQINLYGDGYRASEYYTDFRPSVLENNTVKTTEIADKILYDYFGVEVEKELSLPTEEVTSNDLTQKDIDELNNPCK